jgi:putative copper export protein
VLLVGLPIALLAIVRPILRQHSLDENNALASARWLLRAAALGLTLGGLALFLAQIAPLELDFAPTEWGTFVQQTVLGQMMLVRVATGLMALLALVLLPKTPAAFAVCVVAGIAAQVTHTRTSHTAAMGAGAARIASDYAHLLGSALWAGGLAALVLAMPTALAAPTRSASVTAALIRRFSPMGMAGVALVAGTGLVLTSVHVAEANGLMQTLYGNLIVAKVGATIIAVGLAGMHKFVMQWRMSTAADAARFARTLRIETAVVIGIFLLAAVLTSASPPGHAMDETGQMMTNSETTFQRLLIGGAIAIGTAGLLALALEWRRRSSKPT